MRRDLPRRIDTFLLGSLLALLWVSCIGCATHCVDRKPTPSLSPFSESGDAEMPARWWVAFGDPMLDAHVERALGSNFDLSAALQRLRAARALTRREASDLFPDLDGILGIGSTFGPEPDQTRVTWGLDAAYQVDLWGQIQSRVDAERLRADATHADYHTVALSLAAEVARTWFALIEARAQLKLLDEQVQKNRDGVALQEKRFGVGQSDAADLYRQQQLVQSTLEQVVVVRAQVEVLEHQLAVLLGELPQTASYDPGVQLPDLPPLPDTGLPSDLVSRRPDVRRDYLAFAAADRDLASAMSARYPRLNLTGAVVNVIETPETVFRDWFVSIGGQLIAPLFDGGQRRAEVDRTAATASQRYDEYRQTMLIAFQEVEDNLALERYQVDRIDRLDRQVRLAQRATERLESQSAIRDDVDYLDVLSAVQAEQRLQRDTLSARLDLILIRIGLYLALAGDFDPSPQSFVEPSTKETLGADKAANQPMHPVDSPQRQPQLIERLPSIPNPEPDE